MAYDDKENGLIFPIRNGEAAGQSQERQMMDSVGTQGFRTKIVGDLMLRTKNGRPEFSRVKGYGVGSGDLEAPELTCKLFIDAGIVDLHAAGALDPNLDIEGNIHHTDLTNTVASGVGAGKVQIDIDKKGKITYALNDVLPSEGALARSFSVEAGDYQTKKNVSWQVPSSIFTGRMRLYVQSLYGGINKTILLSKGASMRPTLGINTVANEAAMVPPVVIGSGTGLYFDTNDKSHWIIFPSESSALIIKLKTNFCAEQLRTKLSDESLAEDERERLEAYVLSHAVPDLAVSQEVFYDPTPSESMGYSWHWNWDGDTCDIVDVQEVMVSPGLFGFRSAHYRLKFSRDGIGNFSVARTIEAAPSTWSVPKNINVIAYPEWISGQLIKAGQTASGIDDANQNGVVYCFYAKNELKLVTYTGTFSSYAASRDSSPPHFGGLYWGTEPATLLNAFESGSTSGNDAWDGMRHEFACGGLTIGGENGVVDRDDISAEWVGRTVGIEVGTNQVVFMPQTFDLGVPTFSITYGGVDGGTPMVSGGLTYSDSVTVGIGAWWHAHTGYDEYTYDQEYYTEVKGAFSLIIIPFMDSQAVYMSGQTVSHKTGTGHSGSRARALDGIYDHWRWELLPTYPYSPFYDRYVVADVKSQPGVGGASDTIGPIDETNVNNQSCKLICTHGTFDASPPDNSAFYSAATVVAQTYGTISSANGVVYSPATDIEHGSPTFPLYSTLVGWA